MKIGDIDIMTTNPWQVLNVHRRSTPEEVKAAWKAKMMEAHPDKGGTEAQATEVNLAYKILSSPMLLQSYIDTLTVLGYPCTACGGRGYTYKQQGITGRLISGCPSCGGRGITVQGGL